MKHRDTALPNWLRWIIGSITLLGVSILILSVVLGVRAGQQLLESRSRQQIATTLQQAMELHEQGMIEEAFNAYRSVLLLDPNNATATEGLAALLDRTGNTQPPLASSVVDGGSGRQELSVSESLPPESASPATLTASEREISLFADGQSAFQQGQWEDAIEQLTALQQSNPNHRAAEVNEMLYGAYFSLARQQEQLNQVDAALQSYESAIKVHANPIGAEVAKEILSNYLNVLKMDDGNFPRLIAALEEIFQADPAYRDVSERLQKAYEQYGDKLVSQREWCTAAKQYSLASAIDVTPGLIPKRDRYQAQCTRDDLAEPPVASNERPSNGAATGRMNAASTSASEPVAISPSSSDPNRSESTTNGAGGTDDLSEPEIQVDESAQAVSVQPSAPATGKLLYAARDATDGRFRILMQPANGIGQPTIVVEDGMQPAMRSDGARLVYRNVRSDAIGLAAYDPATALFLRFTDFGEDSVPHWSHEGNRIVFASNREGDRLWRIYTVWAEENGATSNHGFGEFPAWHPSQDIIAYRGCDERGNNCGIWAMNGNGGDRRPLTRVQRDSHPAWSPDGRFLIFMSDGRDGNVELYRMALNTSTVDRLTKSPSIDGVPAVSPSGAWVAFLSNRDGAWRLWRIPIAGGNAEMIAPMLGQPGEWQEQTLQWIQ